MKSTYYLLLIFCMIASSLSAKKRSNFLVNLPDTCTSVQVDSAEVCNYFPVILVGKANSVPDSVCVHFQNSDNYSLTNDSTNSFFGKENALIDFFVRNIVYPHQLKAASAEDNLSLLLKLDKDGNLTESEVLDSEIPEMKQEVQRVIKLLPALVTTDKKGRKTNSSIRVPISFRILKL